MKSVLPEAHVRQWVFTVPIALRYWMARDLTLFNSVHRIIYRELQKSYQKRFREWLPQNHAEFGGISFVHRYSGNLALNTHFHILVPEIGFSETSEGVFGEWIDGPKDLDLEQLIETLASKVIAYLKRVGLRSFFSSIFMSHSFKMALPSNSRKPERGFFKAAE